MSQLTTGNSDGAASWGGPEKAASSAEVSRLLELIGQGQYPGAVDFFEKLHLTADRRYEYLRVLTERALERDLALAAVQFLSILIEQHYHDIGLHIVFARLLADLEWTEEAVKECQITLRLAPNDPFVLDDIGRFLAAQGRLTEAEACLEQLKRLAPDKVAPFITHLVDFGYRSHRNQNPELAVALYKMILKHQPDNDRAIWGCACECIRYKKLTEAEKLIRRAIEVGGERANYLGGLAVVYQHTHRLDQAAEIYEYILNRDPQCPEAMAGLAGLLTARGQFDEAQAWYQKVLELEPDSQEVFCGYGNCLRLMGQFDQAEHYFLRAYQQNPRITNLALNLGLVYIGKKDIDRALHFLWRSVARPEEGLSSQDIVDRIIARLDRLIPAEFQGQKNAVWVMNRCGAFAHVITESFYFANIHHEYDHLFIVGPDKEVYQRLCSGVIDVSTRAFHYLETDDPLFLNLASFDIGTYRRDNSLYSFDTFEHLSEQYFKLRRELDASVDRPRIYFELSEEEGRRGGAIAQTASIPASARVVVLHIREHGYHQLSNQAFRNINIENYVEAIRYLTGQGYYVVRIGDRSMKPLPDLGPMVVDAPFVEGYHPVFDPYIIDRCDFMITCHSGPCALARAFGKPCLVLNAIYSTYHIPETFELLTYKKYYALENGAKRLIRYQEIMDRQIYLLRETQEFEEQNIVLEELTPGEILSAVREMLDDLKLGQVPDSPYQQNFMAINQKESQLLEAEHSKKSPFGPYFGCALKAARISDRYCEMNAPFLD